jgi:hypothetical protein
MMCPNVAERDSRSDTSVIPGVVCLPWVSLFGGFAPAPRPGCVNWQRRFGSNLSLKRRARLGIEA